MNKRQHKKLATTIVAKILAAIIYPEMVFRLSGPETRLWRKDEQFIKDLALQAIRAMKEQTE
ncbi:hypothetical protein [Sporosarcina sp. FSL K6-3457]|uniref:hypothetical protein n=1 Tax=Sporosarcina sp. FSL K6-3457 TaxID=2978204 RepID=UPI0030FBB4E7